MPERRSSAAPGVCRLGAGGNTICRCFTTDGQCSHFWSVGFLLTWMNGLFLSVAQLRRLGMGLNFLAGTNLFLHKHKISKMPHDRQTSFERCSMLGGGGAREARARGRAPGWMRACCWAPSSSRRPVSGAATGASVARRSTQLVATPSHARISRVAAPGSAATVRSTPVRHGLPWMCVCLHSCVPCAVRLHCLPQA